MNEERELGMWILSLAGAAVAFFGVISLSLRMLIRRREVDFLPEILEESEGFKEGELVSTHSAGKSVMQLQSALQAEGRALKGKKADAVIIDYVGGIDFGSDQPLPSSNFEQRDGMKIRQLTLADVAESAAFVRANNELPLTIAKTKTRLTESPLEGAIERAAQWDASQAREQEAMRRLRASDGLPGDGSARSHVADLMRMYTANALAAPSLRRDANDVMRRELEAAFAAQSDTRFMDGIADSFRASKVVWRQPKEPNGRRKILILGAPRAYTSAMAEALAVGLGVPMFFEPFHPDDHAREEYQVKWGIRNEVADAWAPGMDRVKWLQSLPEDGWVVKDLALHEHAYDLPKELPEGLVDEILIPRRDPLQSLCSVALAMAGGGWLTAEPEEFADQMITVTPGVMEEFKSHWVALELLVSNCEHHFKGKFQLINATDFSAVADKLARDGYTLGKNENIQRVRQKLPSERIANMDEVRKFVEGLREIQTDETWRRESSSTETSRLLRMLGGF